MAAKVKRRAIGLTIQSIAHNQDSKTSSFDFAKFSDHTPVVHVSIDETNVTFFAYSTDGRRLDLASHKITSTTWKSSELAKDIKAQIPQMPALSNESESISLVTVWQQITTSLETSQTDFNTWLSGGDYQKYTNSRIHLSKAIDKLFAAGFSFSLDFDWETNGYPPPPSFDPVLERQKTAQLVDELIDAQTQKFDDLEQKEKEEERQRASRMKSKEAEYEAAISSVKSKSADLSAQIANAQNQLTTLKSDVTKDLRQELTKEKGSLAQELDQLDKDLKTKQQAIEKAHQTYQVYLKRLGEATEEAGRAKLVKFFDEAKNNAVWMGVVFLILFLASAGAVVGLLFHAIQEGSDLSWQGVALRITGASMGVYFAIYASRQTTRSRNIYTEYERLAAELSTIEAYLSTQSEDVIRMVKLLMLPEFFGKGVAQITPEELPDVDSANPLQTMNTMTKVLPKMSQGGGRGGGVASIAAATLPALAQKLTEKPPAEDPKPSVAQPPKQLETSLEQLVQAEQAKAGLTAKPAEQPKLGQGSTSTPKPSDKNPTTST